VLVGVEDGTRHVRGVTEPLALEERIASLITATVAARSRGPQFPQDACGSSTGLSQWCAPALSGQGGCGSGYLRTYVRVGSTNRRADAALIAEMRRFARVEVLDEQPMPEISAEAVSFRAASESFAAVRRLRKRGLQTLQLLTEYQGRRVPTAGGILQWGSGIQRMVSTCRDAGLATPVFEEIGVRFRVTLFITQVQEPTLDKLDAAIVGLIRTADGLTTHEIAQKIGLTPRATRTRPAALVARGLVRELGTGPQDPRRRYHIQE